MSIVRQCLTLNLTLTLDSRAVLTLALNLLQRRIVDCRIIDTYKFGHSELLIVGLVLRGTV